MAESKCEACKQAIELAHYDWYGPPFSVRSTRAICFYCLSALRPRVFDTGKGTDIEMVGTYDGDVLTLSEMVADGFDRDRAGRSIRVVGKSLGLPPSVVKKRLSA